MYFSNLSGDFAQQKLESLIAIGANTTEDILQKAIDQFPNHIVLADLNQRLETIAQIVKKVDPIWEKIDNDF